MMKIVTFDAYGQQQPSPLNKRSSAPLLPPPPQIWQNQSHQRASNIKYAKSNLGKSKDYGSKNQNTKYDNPNTT